MDDFNPDAFLAQYKPVVVPSIPVPQNPPAEAPQGAPPQINTQGFDPDEFLQDLREEKFGTPGQQAATALEGASQGVLGSVAPAIETRLGISTPERIRAREETNPITHGVAETGAFVGSALLGTGEAALLGKAAEGAADAARLAGVTNKYAVGAAKAATEMGLFAASDEATKAVLENPDQTVGSAVANVGMSALMGGVFGSSVTGLGALTKAGLDKVGMQEFTDRLAARAAGLHPAESMEKEFTEAINRYHAMNDEVLGPTGLKAQALDKIMPETVSKDMTEQLQNIYDKSNEALIDMRKKGVPERLVNKFQSASQDLIEIATNPEASPSEIFDAMNEFKKELHGYSKGNFGPFAIPSHHEAYDFLNITKQLGHDVRVGLEDSKVWGDVANLQKKLNASWSKILPAVKDVQSKFMEKVGGEYVPSGTKFNTYLNQNGKATSSTIRQKMMGNFVHGVEDHFNAVDSLYKTLGIDNPHPPVSLGSLKESLEKMSLGTKLADYWYDKITPSTLGAGLGAAAVHTALPGAGLAGAYLGKELLGPVMGSMIQPMMEKGFNSGAAQHTAAYISSVLKGEALINKAAKAVMVPGTVLTHARLNPSDEDLKKLDDRASVMNSALDPDRVAATPGKIGEYLPNHGGAIAGTVQNVSAYINSKRPTSEKTSMFSKPPPISKADEAAFKRTLSLMQQPVLVFDHIRNGTLVPQDIADIKSAYPVFYTSSSRALMLEASAKAEAGEPVPFTTQQMLSLYLGRPISQVLEPQSIQAAQPQPKPQPPQQPQGKTKKGTSTLGKSNKNYQTTSQAAESDRGDRN